MDLRATNLACTSNSDQQLGGMALRGLRPWFARCLNRHTRRLYDGVFFTKTQQRCFSLIKIEEENKAKLPKKLQELKTEQLRGLHDHHRHNKEHMHARGVLQMPSKGYTAPRHCNAQASLPLRSHRHGQIEQHANECNGKVEGLHSTARPHQVEGRCEVETSTHTNLDRRMTPRGLRTETGHSRRRKKPSSQGRQQEGEAHHKA